MSTYSREPIVPRAKSSKKKSADLSDADIKAFKSTQTKRTLFGATIWLSGTPAQVEAEYQKLKLQAEKRYGGLNMKSCHEAYFRKKHKENWVSGRHGL